MKTIFSFLVIYLGLFQAQAQLSPSVQGDFNGDGKLETATFIVERKPYFEGGYKPISLPGEYLIRFSDKSIPDIRLGNSAGGLLTKSDFNKNGKDELLFIGSSDDMPILAPEFRFYEFAEKNMQGILTGLVPGLIDGRNCEDSLLITLEDTVYLLSQPMPINVSDMYVLYAQKIYPEKKDRDGDQWPRQKALITKNDKLYPYVKNFVIDSVLFNNRIYLAMDLDTLPQFPGGKEEMQKFIDKNLIYPPYAKELNIEGTVHISFVVNKDGSIHDIRQLNEADEALAREFIRVYKIMPDWVSGIKNGKAVRVTMQASYNFKLR